MFDALDLWTAYCLSRRGTRTLSGAQIDALLNKLGEVLKTLPSALDAISKLSHRLEALKREGPLTLTAHAPINVAFLSFFKAHASELGETGREILGRVALEIERERTT